MFVWAKKALKELNFLFDASLLDQAWQKIIDFSLD